MTHSTAEPMQKYGRISMLVPGLLADGQSQAAQAKPAPRGHQDGSVLNAMMGSVANSSFMQARLAGVVTRSCWQGFRGLRLG